MSSPLVSCIVPTLDRADRHADLYACFDSQTYEPKELLVFDGSKRISPFFSSLADARVRYEHAHRPKGEVTRIGAERNALLELAQGDFCQHLDDDDFYAPEFLSSMMARIGDAALAKLGVWNAIQESSGSIWQWDVTAMGGKHFAVVGAETPIETDVPSDGGDERIAEVFPAWDTVSRISTLALRGKSSRFRRREPKTCLGRARSSLLGSASSRSWTAPTSAFTPCTLRARASSIPSAASVRRAV